MPIAIMSLDKARLIAQYHPDWDLVSIVDVGLQGVYDLTPLDAYNAILRVTFDDITQEDLVLAGGPIPGAPTEEQIQQILDWSHDKDMDRLAVHCLQGISRSAAVAVVIACSRGMTAQKAFDELILPGRHNPNTLVLSLGREVLKMPEIMDEYYRRFGHGRQR